jgi:hypothetical protein
MPKVNGFVFHADTGDFEMYAGDTGSGIFHISRSSGEDWTSDARALFTVTSPGNDIVMQRIYRLDDQYGLGDGVVLIEFHNDDTDDWAPGSYSMERRYDLTPIWDGTPSTARCVDALAEGVAQMIEGDVVRTVFKGTITVNSVDGRI